MKRTILIYSDSTALPRWPSVKPEETWPNLLGSQAEIVHLRGNGGIHAKHVSKIVADDITYYGLGNADNLTVILAFGIVDFAPRPITYKLKFIARLPKIGPMLWSKISRTLYPYRGSIQSLLKYQFTKPSMFKRILEGILLVVHEKHDTILLTTPTPGSQACSRSPGFKESIDLLNQIKSDIAKRFPSVKLVKLNDFGDEDYVSLDDGHHFSVQGHRKVFNSLTSMDKSTF